MSIRTLYSDTRGANAIKYALIGAFIGIGLIASLATMRGSLNQTFGAAATQMDSAVADISPAPAKAGPSVTDWLAKSLANQTSRYISFQKYTITNMSFTDGSSATVRTAMNLSAPYTFFTDPANPDVNYNVTGGKLSMASINQPL